MGSDCLLCGGTYSLPTGKPCPNCKKESKPITKFLEVPVQYQGVEFDKELVPASMSPKYGEYLESLLNEIVVNVAMYQKNLLICSRPNSGKTVWSYTLYARLRSNGVVIPPVRDIVEVKNILNMATKDVEECTLYSKARLCIIRVPRNVSLDIIDFMQYIIERRVRNNGVTIFLYGGHFSDLEKQDYTGKFKYLKGTGAFNTISVQSFGDRNGDKE